jgi:hypothetical protein
MGFAMKMESMLDAMLKIAHPTAATKDGSALFLTQ